MKMVFVIVAFPSETMALKGLFGYHLDKKDEALEFIKKGLVKDIKNPVCKKPMSTSITTRKRGSCRPGGSMRNATASM
jgi:hypothetical protein